MDLNKTSSNFTGWKRVMVASIVLVMALTACGAPMNGASPESGALLAPQFPEAEQALGQAPQQSAKLQKGGLAQGEISGPLVAQEEPVSAAALAASDAAPVEPAFALAAESPEVSAIPAQPAAPVAQALDVPEGSQVGQRAPAFTLQSLDGSAVDLSQLVGRPLIITYWATWCDPCRRELPVMQNVLRDYQDQGLVIVTVNAITQDSVDKVQAAVAEMGLTLPVLLDEGNQFSSTYASIFFPTTYFISPNGVIHSIALGDSSEEDFRARVESLLSQSN